MEQTQGNLPNLILGNTSSIAATGEITGVFFSDALQMHTQKIIKTSFVQFTV